MEVYKIMSTTEEVNELFPVMLSHSPRTKQYPVKQKLKHLELREENIFISVIKKNKFSKKSKHISWIFRARKKNCYLIERQKTKALEDLESVCQSKFSH